MTGSTLLYSKNLQAQQQIYYPVYGYGSTIEVREGTTPYAELPPHRKQEVDKKLWSKAKVNCNRLADRWGEINRPPRKGVVFLQNNPWDIKISDRITVPGSPKLVKTKEVVTKYVSSPNGKPKPLFTKTSVFRCNGGWVDINPDRGRN